MKEHTAAMRHAANTDDRSCPKRPGFGVRGSRRRFEGRQCHEPRLVRASSVAVIMVAEWAVDGKDRRRPSHAAPIGSWRSAWSGIRSPPPGGARHRQRRRFQLSRLLRTARTHGSGHRFNPAIDERYASRRAPRGDCARVVAEFWADSHDSETPRGHWFVILIAFGAHERFERPLGSAAMVWRSTPWNGT